MANADDPDLDDEMLSLAAMGNVRETLALHVPQTEPPTLLAKGELITLHAATAFDGRDRKRLLRMLQYMLRPPFALDAIAKPNPNTVRVYFKAPRENGAVFIDMAPFAFLKKLAALVPPPGVHMLRRTGVFSNAHHLRPQIRTRSPLAQVDDVQLPLFELKRQLKGEPIYRPAKPITPEDDPPRPKRMSWARLLARIFKVDVQACPECGDRMRMLGAVTLPEEIEAILQGRGMLPRGVDQSLS